MEKAEYLRNRQRLLRLVLLAAVPLFVGGVILMLLGPDALRGLGQGLVVLSLLLCLVGFAAGPLRYPRSFGN